MTSTVLTVAIGMLFAFLIGLVAGWKLRQIREGDDGSDQLR